MNDRDAKELTVFRHFMSNARGHVDDRSDCPTQRDINLHEAEGLRERLILKLGIFPDDAAVYEHAKERFEQRSMRFSDKTFDELESGIRGSWIRSSKLVIATFSDDSYRRLADATAKETIGCGLDGIRTEYIREGWIRAAEVALHVPAKLLDESYVRQNLRGMKVLLEELGKQDRPCIGYGCTRIAVSTPTGGPSDRCMGCQDHDEV